MAIKRDTYGNIITSEFENHLKAQLRNEGYIEILMYTPDTSVEISSISSEDKLEICNIDSVKDIKKYTNNTVATLEENLWLLNGRFPIWQNNRVDGYISNSISNENGAFTTNPTMRIQLSRVSDLETMSMILNPAVPTGYPKQILFHLYDENDTELNVVTKNIEWEEPTGEVDEDDQPIMVTKLLDTLPSVNVDLNRNDVFYIVAEFVGTRFRHRRIRVSTVTFGKTIYLNQDAVLNVDYTDKTSFVPDTLPSRTFSFDLNNYDGIYDIDNPNNSYIKLDKQTIVRFRNGYNVAGYEYNQDGTVKMEDWKEFYTTEEVVLDEHGDPVIDPDTGEPLTETVPHERTILQNAWPVVEREDGMVEIEWDDWKELRLMEVSANADESATFSCGSVLDIMEETYTAEIFNGYDRTVEEIANDVLTFENLGSDTIEWSSDGIKVPKYDANQQLLPMDQWEDTPYKDYIISTVVPEIQCKQVFQMLAFAIGATILIKDDGKIKFANLNLQRPESFTHQFNWTYCDFESIPAADQLESIENINELSIPKYRSYLDTSGDIEVQGVGNNLSVCGTATCTASHSEITYQSCYPVGVRIKATTLLGAQIGNCVLYAHRGIININGMQEGETVEVEVLGYPIITETIQEINVTSDSLVLDTKLIKADPGLWLSTGQPDTNGKEQIKKKYLEWYKKKFKYKIKTRGEPLVDAGDYGVIQTQFTSQMPVYILQNHWTFDGAWEGDMEVISLG